MFATLILALGATCPGLPNSTGEPALLTVGLTEAGDVVEAMTERMQPGNRSLVLYGHLAMDPIPWHSGTLCINPLYLQRGPTSIVDTQGRTLDTFDLGDMPPSTIYFQTLYRDHGGRDANLSNLAAMSVSALGAPFGFVERIELDPWTCTTYESEQGPVCNTASELPCYRVDDFDFGGWQIQEHTSGLAFDFLTQGGTDVPLEFRHSRDWEWDVQSVNCQPLYLNTCWDAPPQDQIVIVIDFKVGAYWSRSFVEFDDGSTWTTTLDESPVEVENTTWRPARFDSTSGASKVRVSIYSWTGHDSYGFGYANGSCTTGGDGQLDVDFWRRHHSIGLREPQAP